MSQDPMFWALPGNLLTDPQQLNSYNYARNNPIINKDPSGESLMTGVQGFAMGIGTAAAMSALILSAPVTIPVGVAATVAVGSLALTGYGTYSNYDAYQSGEITRDQFDYNAGAMLGGLTLPTVTGKLTELNNLPVRSSAGPKIMKTADYMGQTPDEFLSYMSKNGKAYVDLRANNSGNINYIAPASQSNSARLTTNPGGTAIISAGLMKNSQVNNLTSSGNLKQISSIVSQLSRLVGQLSSLMRR